MLESLNNYFKYGRIIHKSPNGSCTRKLVGMINSDTIGIRKTIFNKNNQIEKTLTREAHYGKDGLKTSFFSEIYDVNTGKVIDGSAKAYDTRKDFYGVYQF